MRIWSIKIFALNISIFCDLNFIRCFILSFQKENKKQKTRNRFLFEVWIILPFHQLSLDYTPCSNEKLLISIFSKKRLQGDTISKKVWWLNDITNCVFIFMFHFSNDAISLGSSNPFCLCFLESLLFNFYSCIHLKC